MRGVLAVTLFVGVFVSVVLLLGGCDSGATGAVQEGISAACVAGQPDARACDPADTKKTTICHIPPGNPANAHTLCVGNPAVPAHLAHGDHTGACDAECGNDAGTTGSATSGGTTGGGTTGATTSGGTTGSTTGAPPPF
jgi:hypothetical protein